MHIEMDVDVMCIFSDGLYLYTLPKYKPALANFSTSISTSICLSLCTSPSSIYTDIYMYIRMYV